MLEELISGGHDTRDAVYLLRQAENILRLHRGDRDRLRVLAQVQPKEEVPRASTASRDPREVLALLSSTETVPEAPVVVCPVVHLSQ
jgi:hypothetical protein